MFLISINVGNLGIEPSGNNQNCVVSFAACLFPASIMLAALLNGKGCYLRMPINWSCSAREALIAKLGDWRRSPGAIFEQYSPSRLSVCPSPLL